MTPVAALRLEVLLSVAAKARLTFTPAERLVFGEALRLLERRRYAAREESWSAIAERQPSHGPPVSALP